jgi:hypothetical protein
MKPTPLKTLNLSRYVRINTYAHEGKYRHVLQVRFMWMWHDDYSIISDDQNIDRDTVWVMLELAKKR